MKIAHALIDILPGINPLPDSTPNKSLFWVYGNKVRFKDGSPQKLGGWERLEFEENKEINGTPRAIFGFVNHNMPWYLIGTEKKLFALLGRQLFNITPIDTDHRIKLDNNPIAIKNGTKNLLITISNIECINEGDRISLQGLEAIGNYTVEQLNREYVVTSKTDAGFVVALDSPAVITQSGGGNNGYLYCEITSRNSDAYIAFGYGRGRYGDGKYGASRRSNQLTVPASTWVFCKYGDHVLMTSGDEGKLYYWDGNLDKAPRQVEGAPNSINYVYVINNVVVTYGAENVSNRRKWSDQGDFMSWMPTITNQAGEDDIEGAGAFLAHIQLNDSLVLDFTPHHTYVTRYVGGAFVFKTELIEPNHGIISKHAGVAVGGAAYWMGQDDFYCYNGGIVRPIGGGNGGVNSTIKQYVFTRLNRDQQSKVHCFYNRKFNEIFWYYPSEKNNEIDSYVIYNISENNWCIGTHARTAGERPYQIQEYPILADNHGRLFYHEKGYDENLGLMPVQIVQENGEELTLEKDGTPLFYETSEQVIHPIVAELVSNFSSIGNGTYLMDIMGIIPDSTQLGELSIEIFTKLYPQSKKIRASKAFKINQSTEKIDCIETGRLRQYRISSGEIGSWWRLGKWFEKIQKGTHE